MINMKATTRRVRKMVQGLTHGMMEVITTEIGLRTESRAKGHTVNIFF